MKQRVSSPAILHAPTAHTHRTTPQWCVDNYAPCDYSVDQSSVVCVQHPVNNLELQATTPTSQKEGRSAVTLKPQGGSETANNPTYKGPSFKRALNCLVYFKRKSLCCDIALYLTHPPKASSLQRRPSLPFPQGERATLRPFCEIVYGGWLSEDI